MRLSSREFNAMNNPLRRFCQRFIEFPVFRKIGLQQMKCDILELGCGSGYGAALLSRLHPMSYLGIDLMEEQITLAKRRNIPGAVFVQGNASRLDGAPDGSKDMVVIFGKLHYMPCWTGAVRECTRALVREGAFSSMSPAGVSSGNRTDCSNGDMPVMRVSILPSLRPRWPKTAS
jgi:ubiquinone/menaquinone biosynthesis C-methylase UbiE